MGSGLGLGSGLWLGPGLRFEHLVHGADVDEVGLLVLGVHVLDGEGEAAPAHEAQRRAAARLPHVEHALREGHERVDRAVVVDLGDELLGWGQG